MTREEAIQIIRETYHTDEEMKALESLIPELRESEDERIRKELCGFLNHLYSEGKVALENWKYKDVANWLAYLEKQKEKQDYSGLTDLERAIHRGFLCAGVENVPVTIIKETAQDCLASVKWSEEEARFIDAIDKAVRYYPYEYKWQNRILNWLKSLRPQPKQEWSAEDEKIMQTMIKEGDLKPSEIAWLKSLRPQKKEDLPKWLVDEDYDEKIDGKDFSLHPVGLAYRGFYIPYSDLLKLPREDEK